MKTDRIMEKSTGSVNKDIKPSITLFNTDPAVLLKEMVIKPVLASGPGGQHINKTSSAIQVFHPQSGIRFRVQDSRSQFMNRETAVERLSMKLKKLNEKNKRKIEEEKRKNKVGKKPRRVKERILREKHKKSEKKKERKFSDE